MDEERNRQWSGDHPVANALQLLSRCGRRAGRSAKARDRLSERSLGIRGSLLAEGSGEEADDRYLPWCVELLGFRACLPANPLRRAAELPCQLAEVWRKGRLLDRLSTERRSK